MASVDPLNDLAHDHDELNRRVLALAARIEALRAALHRTTSLALIEMLHELREPLFLHFAREEEGLFPFVAEFDPELASQVGAMAAAHDTICGALARMCQLAAADAPIASLVPRLITCAQAVRLMGAHLLLCGPSAGACTTLAEHAADLRGGETFGSRVEALECGEKPVAPLGR